VTEVVADLIGRGSSHLAQDFDFDVVVWGAGLGGARSTRVLSDVVIDYNRHLDLLSLSLARTNPE